MGQPKSIDLSERAQLGPDSTRQGSSARTRAPAHTDEPQSRMSRYDTVPSDNLGQAVMHCKSLRRILFTVAAISVETVNLTITHGQSSLLGEDHGRACLAREHPMLGSAWRSGGE